MALSNDDLQAIAMLLDQKLSNNNQILEQKLHENNEYIYSEMERLHDIQMRKIDSMSEKVDTIRDNKETTDYLLKQLSILKDRVDELENKIA